MSIKKYSIEEEIFPLVDEEGSVIGEATRSKCHDGTKLLHPVIHLHVFNSKGELFLQKRSHCKDIESDKWDSAVGGHIDLGENPLQAVLRESREEIGLVGVNAFFVKKYIIETQLERELTYCYYCIYDGEFVIDRDELADGRFWSIVEVTDMIGKNVFTPNFELDFDQFLKGGLTELVETHFEC